MYCVLEFNQSQWLIPFIEFNAIAKMTKSNVQINEQFIHFRQ